MIRAASPSPRKWTAAGAVLLFLAVVAVYAPAFADSFLLNWDDVHYVVDNDVAHGLTIDHVQAAFTRFFVGNYAPIHVFSYMIDYEIWGLRPVGYVLTNVVLHAASAVLLLTLLLRVFHRLAPALAGASLWALHPVQVESVAWISQRKNVLAMFFFLTAFHLWISYRDGRRPRLSYALSVVAFVLSLLAKSVAVILPVALLLFDVTHRRTRERRRLLADKVPHVAAALACGLVAIVSQTPAASSGRTPYLGGDAMASGFTMSTVLAKYLRLLLAPTGLSAAYDPPIRASLDATVAASFLLIAALVAIGVFLWRRRREAFFWYGLFFLGLLPVSQIFGLVTLMNDRYLYFPLLGAAPLVGLLAFPESPLPRRRPVAWASVAAALVLAALSVARVRVWKDDVSLWSDAAAKSPHSADVWFALGNSLDDAGRRDESVDAYLHVLSIDPDYSFARLNLGQAGLLGARSRLTARTAAGVASPDDLLLLGTADLFVGDLDGAARAYSRAAEATGSRAAVFGLGTTQLAAGRLAEARATLSRAASLGDRDPRIEYQRARVEALAGDRPAALVHLRAALRLGYKDPVLVARDPSLASIRSTPEFEELFRRFFRRSPTTAATT